MLSADDRNIRISRGCRSKLDKPAARRILKAIDALSVGPRPSGARPLVAYPDLWRIRVGDYRVVSTVKGAELVVLALRVAHRSTVYGHL
jgi:mRNA interferase RelE/StbE